MHLTSHTRTTAYSNHACAGGLRTTNSLAVGGSVVMSIVSVHRILADVHPVHAPLFLSLSLLYTLSIPLFCTLYARLRVNREFHRVSTIGPNSTPAIFLLFLVCDFYVHMWHTFQVYMYINEFTRLTIISRYSLILVFP